MHNKNCISWVALVASIVAIVMSGMAMVKQNENPELGKDAVADIVYDRVVAEVADEFKPVYSDMGLEFPSNASSLSELFKPLVGITQDMTVEE